MGGGPDDGAVVVVGLFVAVAARLLRDAELVQVLVLQCVDADGWRGLWAVEALGGDGLAGGLGSSLGGWDMGGEGPDGLGGGEAGRGWVMGDVQLLCPVRGKRMLRGGRMRGAGRGSSGRENWKACCRERERTRQGERASLSLDV